MSDDRIVIAPDADLYGTSLQGYFTASYADLVRLLGPPGAEPSCDGKVSTSWVVTFRGKVYNIYDYKETNLYHRDNPTVVTFRARSSYAWHVGARGDAKAFVEAIQSVLAELPPAVRGTLRDQVTAIGVRELGQAFVDAVHFPTLVSELAKYGFEYEWITDCQDNRAIRKALKLFRSPGYVTDEEPAVD